MFKNKPIKQPANQSTSPHVLSCFLMGVSFAHSFMFSLNWDRYLSPVQLEQVINVIILSSTHHLVPCLSCLNACQSHPPHPPKWINWDWLQGGLRRSIEDPHFLQGYLKLYWRNTRRENVSLLRTQYELGRCWVWVHHRNWSELFSWAGRLLPHLWNGIN